MALLPQVTLRQCLVMNIEINTRLGAVDTVMLSQYSDNSVAAVGVVNQLIMFALSTG